MMAKYDILNPKALRELVAGGAQLRPFPQDVMEACFKAATDTYAELSATERELQEGATIRWRPSGAKGISGGRSPRERFDSFMMAQQRAKAL